MLATIGLFYVGWKKVGKSLSASLDKEIDVCNLINWIYLHNKLLNNYNCIKEYEASCNSGRQSEIDSLKETVEGQKKEVWRTEAQQHIIQAKRENISIQLDTIYRERALHVYNQVLCSGYNLILLCCTYQSNLDTNTFNKNPQ